MNGVVARCPRCKGWTMFHGDASSATAHEWTAACRRDGDIIVVGVIDKLGPACAQAATKPAQRTCEAAPSVGVAL